MLKEKKSVLLDKQIVGVIDRFSNSNINNDFSAKLNEIVEEFNDVINYTKTEIMNYFKENELLLIANCLKNSFYNPRTSPKMTLAANIEDSIALNNSNNTYNVDEGQLLEKINNLSEFQCYTIIKEIQSYWNNHNQIDSKILKDLFVH